MNTRLFRYAFITFLLILLTHCMLTAQEASRRSVNRSADAIDSAEAFCSDGGLSWKPSNRGLLPGNVLTIVAGINGEVYAAVGDRLARSTDGGASWSDSSLGGEIDARSIVATARGTLLAIDVINHINRSTDGGLTWSTTDSTLSAFASGLFPAADGNVYTGASGYVCRSTDDGDTWARLFPLKGDTLLIGAAFVGGHFVFPLDYNWFTGPGDGGVLMVTPSWDRIGAGDCSSRKLYDLLVTPRGTLMATSVMYFRSNDSVATVPMRSTDGGSTWSLITEPRLLKPRALAVDSIGRIFISTGPSVSYSTDEGVTWNSLDAGLAGKETNRFAVSPEGTVYAAVNDGVYVLTSTTSHVSNEAGGGGATIQRITPNPTSATATLHFHLDRASSVSVHLHDPLGREVLSLPAMQLDPGEHAIPIDGSSLRSGVYLCSVMTGRDVRSLRLVIAR